MSQYIPTKHDVEHCPLCLQKWTIVEEPGKKGKIYLACIRPKCEISIHINDPLLGKYFGDASEPCPLCREPKMRLFFRSDMYIKMVCVKCGAVVESVDNEKHAALMKKEVAEGSRKITKPRFN